MCIKEKLGSCRGCPMLDIGIRKVRWNGYGINEAKEYLRKKYCPSGCHPNVELAINNEANLSMGQHTSENLEGLNNLGNKPKHKKRSNGKVISKASTERWFR